MELDETLARIAAAPVPDLAMIEGSTLAARAQSRQRTGRTALGLALAGSFGIGLVGGLQAPLAEEAPLAAFGPSPALTPLIGLAQG